MIIVNEDTTLVGVAELRTDTSKVLKEMKKHSVVLTRRNRPVGVLLDYGEYERMRNTIEEYEDMLLETIARGRSEREGKKVVSLEEAEKRLGLR